MAFAFHFQAGESGPHNPPWVGDSGLEVPVHDCREECIRERYLNDYPERRDILDHPGNGRYVQPGMAGLDWPSYM